ncbi:hypothetical protein PSGK_14490 [Pseudomonas solani]|uniref:hypothetical protein n=1 Tax=Pseudomonas solani TaxID=2731552 RepID=UPI0035BE94A3
MAIVVKDFDVTAVKHPDASSNNISWLVVININFASDDPAEWGELRAYGGSWIRCRKINNANKVKEQATQVMNMRDLDGIDDIENCHVQISAVRNLPLWPCERPTDNDELKRADMRLGNDQHIEIFYSKVVSGVPRSKPTTKNSRDPEYLSYDPMVDTMSYDNINVAERPHEIKLNLYHVVGRDEPGWENFVRNGYFCEYYHAAEFHIRPPNSTQVIARKKLLLTVKGNYGEYKYASTVG